MVFTLYFVSYIVIGGEMINLDLVAVVLMLIISLFAGFISGYLYCYQIHRLK